MSELTSPTAAFLDRLRQRSQLSEDDEKVVLSLPGRKKSFDPLQRIVDFGEPTTHATLIIEGIAARVETFRDGDREISAVHIPGDMCDLHSVVVPIASWGIEALTRTTIYAIPHAALLEISRNIPSLGTAFWRETTVDGTMFAKWVGVMGRREARVRLAHLFCEVGLRMELAKRGTRTRFRFDVTQYQMAEMAGLTSIHINRTLQSMRADGIVKFDRGAVEIPDWQKLVDTAEFDPAYLQIPGLDG